MRRYDIIIIDQKEIKKQFEETIIFTKNGFLSDENKVHEVW